MTYTRKKIIKGKEYLYIQKSKRHGSKVKTQHVKYVGKAKPSSMIGLTPGAVITGATGKGTLTAIPFTHAVGIGAGFGLYMSGLFIFNRQMIKYRKAKAEKEVSKQKEIIERFVNILKSKYPNATKEQLRVYVKKELEKRYLEKQEANKQGRSEKTEFPEDEDKGLEDFHRKVISDIKGNMSKSKGSEATNQELFLELRKRHPDMSEYKIRHLINEYA